MRVVFKVFRSMGSTLKVAQKPEQRAYVVASAYAILLKQRAKVAEAQGRLKKLVGSLWDIDRLVRPVIEEYVEAVRFKS